VILMTALGTAEMTERLGSAGAFECLSKPFDVGVLKRKILDMLAQRVRGRVENISLSSFLQLLEMERKTCTLGITAGERRGKLFFRGGKLVGAETGALAESDAALEIVSWEQADIEIIEGCPVAAPPLPGGLPFLLMEAMRLKDEREREAQGGDDDLDALLAAPALAPSSAVDAAPAADAAAPAADPAADSSATVREALERGREVEGVVATVLAETRTGAVLAAAVGPRKVDVETAAAGAAALARSQDEVERELGPREAVEELLLTAARHLYLVRPLNGERFLLMLLDRRKADLEAARPALAAIAAVLG
jgi:hypothetical protein